MSTFKIGILIDREPDERLVLELYEWGMQQDDLSIACLIVCAPAGHAGPGIAMRVLENIERRIARLLPGRSAKYASRPATNTVTPRSVLRLAPPLSDAHSYTMRKLDVELVRALHLDLVVQFGWKEYRGDVLGAARLGSLVLDYRGNRSSKHAAPGFWEAYYGLPKSQFSITHHTASNPDGKTVVSGAFATKYLFSLNRAHLQGKALAQLRQLLRKAAVLDAVPVQESASPFAGPRHGTPGVLHTLAYGAKMAWRIGARMAYKALRLRYKWGISLVQGDWRNAALWRSTQLAAPRGHFWADPFLHQHDGKTYCFVEDFVYAAGRAHIAVLQLTPSGARELGTCIAENFHQSFPFLFSYDGVLYMCPESSAARQVRIYRCVNFPLQWELCHVALDDTSAADSMLFAYGGKWWLMTNIDQSGLDDHCSELYLFSGESPFEKNWVPHPHNPIRMDSEGGRNAGLIIEGGKLFRGAQRQGFDQYGQGLMLYEIVELNEFTYHERLVSEICGDFRGGLLGAHHMSTTGEITVVDHVSRCFFP